LIRYEATADSHGSQQLGIQVRLGDYKGDEFLVYVDIVRRETPSGMQSFLFVKDSPHVPDGRHQRYGGEDLKWSS
jgi:hypothetical protein